MLCMLLVPHCSLPQQGVVTATNMMVLGMTVPLDARLALHTICTSHLTIVPQPDALGHAELHPHWSISAPIL
jgi:hypothetical protein